MADNSQSVDDTDNKFMLFMNSLLFLFARGNETKRESEWFFSLIAMNFSGPTSLHHYSLLSMPEKYQ